MFICMGALKYESCWGCLTTRVYDEGIGNFSDRKQGWVPKMVAVHLCKICL